MSRACCGTWWRRRCVASASPPPPPMRGRRDGRPHLGRRADAPRLPGAAAAGTARHADGRPAPRRDHGRRLPGRGRPAPDRPVAACRLAGRDMTAPGLVLTAAAWDGKGIDPWLPQRIAAEVDVTAAERRVYTTWWSS